MIAEHQTGTAPGSGRERTRHLHWRLWAAALALALLFTPIATGLTHPAGVARAQDEVAADMTVPRQVIAQGIARLPKDDVAWTVRTIEVPGGEGTPVESFPIGFAVADDATIAVLDAKGEVLNLLEDGEAAFLPNGKDGALASWQEDMARLYEVALVSGQEASAGETPGTIAGNPFAAPEGNAFDIEIARTMLTRVDQTTVPASRSGTPILYLQTAGTTQLQAGGGPPLELATGQFALLLGDVTVRGTSDEPATFLVAAIGEATVERDATAGTPEARASREDRQGGRTGNAQSDDEPRAANTKQKRPKRARTEGGGRGDAVQGRQSAPAGTAGTGTAPISGGVGATAPAGAPADTPPLEPTVAATLPGDTAAPADGTPPPEATIPTEDEAPTDVTVTPDPAAPADDIIPTEEPVTGEQLPTVEAPPAEEIVPADEAPAEEPPIVEEPVVEPPAEEPVAEPTAEP
ncbi:MAG: hypothetical protein K0S99_3257 [Thermomicrobiales bacterium]|nr:hypothetical protein [Thermomicrobiales bacterium]